MTQYSLKHYAQYIATTEVVDNGAQFKLKVYLKPENYQTHSRMFAVMLKVKLKQHFDVDCVFKHYPEFNCVVFTADKQAYGNNMNVDSMNFLLGTSIPEYV